jgi:hypothetical protein
MKSLLDWRLALILAAGAMLGGCRRVPPPVPGDPTRDRPLPQALVWPYFQPFAPPHRFFGDQPMPQSLAVPRRNPEPKTVIVPGEIATPRRPWGSPGDTVKPSLEYTPLGYNAKK